MNFCCSEQQSFVQGRNTSMYMQMLYFSFHFFYELCCFRVLYQTYGVVFHRFTSIINPQNSSLTFEVDIVLFHNTWPIKYIYQSANVFFSKLLIIFIFNSLKFNHAYSMVLMTIFSLLFATPLCCALFPQKR